MTTTELADIVAQLDRVEHNLDALAELADRGGLAEREPLVTGMAAARALLAEVLAKLDSLGPTTTCGALPRQAQRGPTGGPR